MSDAQTIQFELVSPEEKLVSEPVNMAVIPGEKGQFGVMAGHSSLVATLQPGVVELFAEDGAAEPAMKIFIAGGFADISGGQCTVLAEEAVNVKDLVQADLEQSIENLNEDLGIAKEDIDKARIEKRLVLTKAKLSAVSGNLVAW